MTTQLKTIATILIISLLYLISIWKIAGTWREIENNKLNVERSRTLNEVCGNRDGSYQLGNITCE